MKITNMDMNRVVTILNIVEDTESSYWDDGNGLFHYRMNKTVIGTSPQYSTAIC